jgi:hypothetical protein
MFMDRGTKWIFKRLGSEMSAWRHAPQERFAPLELGAYLRVNVP